MSGAWYNENDPKAAAWLRELIKAGEIADGEVDERSIEDVVPSEIAGFTQCHFFAGIGVWSYALRRAGWPDDRPVWTGSCPCQPFSASGKKGGFDDERHLWPAWHHLIRECRPPIVIGEQVASKDGLTWLDLVSADMEGEGYALGASDLCAAGVGPWLHETQLGRRLVGEAEWAAAQETDPARESVWREFADYLSGLVFGAPHIRQRLYFVGLANAASGRCKPRSRHFGICGTDAGPPATTEQSGVDGASERLANAAPEQHDWAGGRRARGWAEHPDGGDARVLANAHDARPQGRGIGGNGAGERAAGSGGVVGGLDDTASARHERTIQDAEGDPRNKAWVRMSGAGCGPGRLADAARDGRREERADGQGGVSGDGAQGRSAGLVAGGDAGGVADAEHALGGQVGLAGEDGHHRADQGRAQTHGVSGARSAVLQPNPNESGWHDPDWLFCRDGKWRPVEPGLEPLVDEAAARVGRLRGYGNAIHAGTAQTFVEEVMGLLDD